MSKYKDKKPSMIEFTRKYANNDQACEEFFFRSKYGEIAYIYLQTNLYSI